MNLDNVRYLLRQHFKNTTESMLTRMERIAILSRFHYSLVAQLVERVTVNH